MKTPLLSLLVFIMAGVLSSAQPSPRSVVPGGTVSARDGFTKSGTSILLTRGGVSQKIGTEVRLENGLRVQDDGTVTLLTGEKATLRDNQLLTLDGTFEDVALSPEGTAPVSSVIPPLKQSGETVSIAATDGVSIAGGVALVTRNGVAQPLSQELKLTNGTTVKADGTVRSADGKQIKLRENQRLTFDGTLLETPVRPSLPAPAPAR